MTKTKAFFKGFIIPTIVSAFLGWLMLTSSSEGIDIGGGLIVGVLILALPFFYFVPAYSIGKKHPEVMGHVLLGGITSLLLAIILVYFFGDVF